MNFNHVMIYVRDVPRALDFYAGKLGLAVIESSPEGGYARLKFPEGDGTMALHAVEAGHDVGAEGMRLYFEVEALDDFCDRLEQRGVLLKQKPADMPWGWRHAYVDDPDGHELSFYWAGDRRLRAGR
jgi:catechol 2,3-dioxygenase-like lactoylglutathione lyase family enzyme